MSQNYYSQEEITALGECLAQCYFSDAGSNKLPVDPEIVATKYFGLNIFPQHQLTSAGVRSGIDTSQSVIFIDYDTYMNDGLQWSARQGIAHELGHAIFDTPLIRQLAAGTNSEDAFGLHELLVNNHERNIESRANMLSGALLVPRSHLVKQVASMIAQNYERAIGLYPNMTLGEVFEQMASSPLSRRFGVSDDVIAWRFKLGELHHVFGATPETPLAKVSLKNVSKVAGMTYTPPALTDRIKALLPEEILNYQRGLAAA